MVRQSLHECVLIVKTFYCHSERYAETMRHHRRVMSRNEAPNESTVRRLMVKFKKLAQCKMSKLLRVKAVADHFWAKKWLLTVF